MRTYFFAIVSFFCFVAVTSAFPHETVFSGSLTSQVGVGLPNTDRNKGKFLLGQTILDGTIKSHFEKSMIFVNAQVVHDALGSLSSNGSSGFVADDGTYALKLREAYIDWKGEMLALRIGRQITSWGKADDIQITDVLNPRDESSFIASDYNDSKLGVDAIRLSLLIEKTQIDAYWIPFLTPSILPLAKGNPLNSLFFPRLFEYISKVDVPEKYSDFELPEKKLSHSEFALRTSVYTSLADLSLYGFYGWDDRPIIKHLPYINDMFEENTLDTIVVSGTYKHMYMVGADVAIPYDDFVFRFEGAFFPKRHIQTSNDYQLKKFVDEKIIPTNERKNQAIGLIGIDWTPSEDWNITAQYVIDKIFNHNDNLDRRDYEHQATLSIKKSVLNETLTLMASGALDLRHFSSASELEIDYQVTKAITLSLICDLYLDNPAITTDGKYTKYLNFSGITFKGYMSF